MEGFGALFLPEEPGFQVEAEGGDGVVEVEVDEEGVAEEVAGPGEGGEAQRSLVEASGQVGEGGR